VCAAGCGVCGLGKACGGTGSGKGIKGRTGKVITGGITGINFSGDARSASGAKCCAARDLADLDHAAITWGGGSWWG
jgi:hypothetical protein